MHHTIRQLYTGVAVQEAKRIAVSFRVTPAFKRCLELAALAERRSQTNLIEKLVFEYCKDAGISIEMSEQDAIQRADAREL